MFNILKKKQPIKKQPTMLDIYKKGNRKQRRDVLALLKKRYKNYEPEKS